MGYEMILAEARRCAMELSEADRSEYRRIAGEWAFSDLEEALMVLMEGRDSVPSPGELERKVRELVEPYTAGTVAVLPRAELSVNG